MYRRTGTWVEAGAFMTPRVHTAAVDVGSSSSDTTGVAVSDVIF